MAPRSLRWISLALLTLSAACANETYTCCVEGLIETCECPGDANCLTPTVIDNGDGTCQQEDTGGGAEGG